MFLHCSRAMFVRDPLLNYKSRVLISNSKRYTGFGIDLGSTCTRAAIVKRKKGDSNYFETKVVKDIPSVISFLKDGKCLVGRAAETRVIPSALNTFCATKRLIGRRFNDPIVQEAIKHVGYNIFHSSGGKPCLLSTNINRMLTPTELEALFLIKMKELCEIKLEEPMKNVVLTVPAYFNSDQIEITKEAGRIAGLNVLDVINAPSAALLAYPTPYENFDESKIVVVYDFGGTTFNVSVLKITKGFSNPEILSNVEDLFLGGEDFDKMLVDYFVAELKRITKFDMTLDKLSMQWLKKSAENAKIHLSMFTEMNVDFWSMRMPNRQSAQRSRVDRIALELTRTKFEELVVKLINKTTTLCQKALEEAKISVSDIDEVFAIGGTSKIPKVRETVREIFGKELVQSGDIYREEAAAIGAALRGYELKHEIPNDDPDSLDISINIPKPVMAHEVFNYSATDDLKEDSITPSMERNHIESGIVSLVPDEQADNFILQQPNVHEDVSLITAYNRFKESKHMETQPSRLRKELMDFIRQKKYKVVQEELAK